MTEKPNKAFFVFILFMNLVLFSNPSDCATVLFWFPKESLVCCRVIGSLVEWNAWKKVVLPLGVTRGVLLSKPDGLVLRAARSTGVWIGVQGSSVVLSHWAVQSKVDALVVLDGTVWDFSVLRLAASQGVTVGVLFSGLFSSVTVQSQWFRNAFFLALCCKKARASFSVWSGATRAVDFCSDLDLKGVELFLLAESR